MSGDCGDSVSQETILGIRNELSITPDCDNYDDEDISAVMKECNMSPVETVEMLKYLAGFQEVKKKKRNPTRARPPESRGFAGPWPQAPRGNRGSNSSREALDVPGGRNTTARRENRVNHRSKARNSTPSEVTKSETSANGRAPHPRSNGNKSGPSKPQTSTAVKSPPEAKSKSKPTSTATLTTPSGSIVGQGEFTSISAETPTSTTSESVSGVYSSASDPVLVAPHASRMPSTVGAIGREIGSPLDMGKHVSHEVSRLSLNDGSVTSRSTFTCEGKLRKEHADSSKVEARSHSQPSEGAARNNLRRSELIFSNAFQVPEAHKYGLVFGSLDFVAGSNHVDVSECEKNAVAVTESIHANCETSVEPCESNRSVSLTVQDEYLNHPQSVAPVPVNLPPSEGDLTSDAAPNYMNYSSGFVSPIPGFQQVQAEGVETKARDVAQLSNLGGAGVVPSSAAASSLPVPVIRPSYPNHIPYNYYSPYYVQQFVGHGGFPQQSTTSGVYLTPTKSATGGQKFPLPPQYKPGSNTGNPVQVGLSSGLGAYGSSPLGYNSIPEDVSSESNAGNDVLTASHSQPKENVYVNEQQAEGSSIWIPATDQNISALQANSYYNFVPQGQHVAFSPTQAAGAFTGIYQPSHTLAAAPASSHSLLPQSQSMMLASLETRLPHSAYHQQQQQHQQIIQNANY